MQNAISNIQVNSDDAVIAEILRGNISLFEVLIRRYNSVLYKIARSYGFNHQDAQDLMQDTHVSAYLGLAKFEGRAAYKTWISRIMVNKCLYKLKYGYYKNEFSSEEKPNDQPIHMRKNENPTENVLLNRELASVLEKSLTGIPEIYRM